MKSRIVSMLVIGLLMIAGPAYAGKGGPIVAGYWEGSGEAIYPDGTKAEVTLVQVQVFQEGQFIYGLSEFEVDLGAGGPIVQAAQLSGYMDGNIIIGVMGGCLGPAPDCIGGGILRGKVSGNRLQGTLQDLSDGSTAIITLRRLGG
jgi:hypothetical protein